MNAPTRILACIDQGTERGRNVLRFVVRNSPVESKERDANGEPVLGVPYDYSELVFDLFYTIDSFPRENGVEFIHAVRQGSVNRSVPILMLNAESEDDKKQRGKAAGATAWLTKPFEQDQ
ncbi:MAG: response regulator, partial [Spirochaetota bacterium]